MMTVPFEAFRRWLSGMFRLPTPLSPALERPVWFAVGSQTGLMPMNGGAPAPIGLTFGDAMRDVVPGYTDLFRANGTEAIERDWFEPASHLRTLPQALDARLEKPVIARIGEEAFSELRRKLDSHAGPIKEERLRLLVESLRALWFYREALRAASYAGEAMRLERLMTYCRVLNLVPLGESALFDGVWHAVQGTPPEREEAVLIDG